MDSTPLASRALSAILTAHDWNQTDLASKCGIVAPTISAHLSGTRVIRDDHLAAYCKALGPHDQRSLVAAWLRDTLDTGTIDNILNNSGRLQEEVSAWRPGLDPEQQDMIAWWIRQLAGDRELDSIFRGISRKAGWEPSAQSTSSDGQQIAIQLSPSTTHYGRGSEKAG